MTRAKLILVCVLALGVAGCGGGGDSTRAAAPQAPLPTASGARLERGHSGPITTAATRAAAATTPRDCERWFEPGNGRTICHAYIAAGSLHAGATPASITDSGGGKALAEMHQPGANAFALLLRRRNGASWRVYDAAGFLPAAGP